MTRIQKESPFEIRPQLLFLGGVGGMNVRPRYSRDAI
jgi:hypothetical protein